MIKMKEKEEYELGHILILVPEDANANQINSKRKLHKVQKKKLQRVLIFMKCLLPSLMPRMHLMVVILGGDL